jgi:hypothetical protein
MHSLDRELISSTRVHGIDIGEQIKLHMLYHNKVSKGINEINTLQQNDQISFRSARKISNIITEAVLLLKQLGSKFLLVDYRSHSARVYRHKQWKKSHTSFLSGFGIPFSGLG